MKIRITNGCAKVIRTYISLKLHSTFEFGKGRSVRVMVRLFNEM